MATTKKSTKAKTKTTKKPVTTKSKAAGTAKRSVSAKAPAPVVSKNSAVRTTGKMLMQLQLVSVVLSLSLAAMAVVYMNQRSYQLFTGLLTSDELASKATTVFVPAIRSVYDVEMRWVLSGLMVLSAIIPLLYLTRFKNQFQNGLQKRVLLWRWIDMAVIGALAMEVVALLSGVQDVSTLKLIGGLVVVSGLLAWLAEKQHAETDRPATAAFVLSIVTGLLPWLVIATYAVATPLYGMVRNTGFVYGLYAVLLFGFVAVAVTLRKHLKDVRRQTDYAITERNYSFISILTRSAFAVVLILGLIKG